MRNLFLCLLVVLLSSCIPVEDFGSYWKKGTIDPALLGKWGKMIPRDEDDRKESRSVKTANEGGIQVADKGGTYQIDSLDEDERQKKDYAPVFARTLKAGRYTFLMAITKEGDAKARVTKGLVRYKLEGDTFQQYHLVDERMGSFLKEKYPEVKNIEKPDCKGKVLV